MCVRNSDLETISRNVGHCGGPHTAAHYDGYIGDRIHKLLAEKLITSYWYTSIVRTISVSLQARRAKSRKSLTNQLISNL